jgi:hypothetical protein
MSSNKKCLFDSFIPPNKFYKTMQWGLTEQYKVQKDYKWKIPASLYSGCIFQCLWCNFRAFRGLHFEVSTITHINRNVNEFKINWPAAFICKYQHSKIFTLQLLLNFCSGISSTQCVMLQCHDSSYSELGIVCYSSKIQVILDWLVIAILPSHYSGLDSNGYITMTSFTYNRQDATLYSILYYCQCCTCFRRFLHPSSGAQNCTHSIRYMSSLLAATISSKLDINPMLCVQFWAPDDGWRNSLKHAEHWQ